MGSIEKFEDLEIWQLARELVKEIYKLTWKKEFSKDYGLRDQIHRSSVSAMNNISEGFESRNYEKIYKLFRACQGIKRGNKIGFLCSFRL